jgi:hypothetical protein
MNKTLRTAMLGILISVFYGVSVYAQNSLPQSIVSATAAGNARDLAAGFNDNIELVLPQKSGIFSKSQAEMVLKDFFSKNPPSSFKVIHEGSRQNASFAIGNYKSGNSFYRFYFLTKKTNNKVLIHQLRIERQ